VTSSNGPSADASARPGAGGVGGYGTVADRNLLPDRVWTLPNALSVLRLLGVPLFLWLLLGPQADGWAVVVLMVAGATDWADGKLARSLGQSSRLGALLDPAADRLYIVATLVAFVLRDVVPLWLVAALVGRELVLGLALLVCAPTATRRCRCTTWARRRPSSCSTPSRCCSSPTATGRSRPSWRRSRGR
jgi:cardiolipin synthase